MASSLPDPAAGSAKSPLDFPSAWSLSEVVASLPAACVLLTPTLHVAAASNAYLAVFGLTQAQLLGRTLFDVFPGSPGTPEGDTITSLRASLEQVLATGEPHHMAVQHYAVPDPTAPGQLMGRYWDPSNSAIRDAQGTVTGLVHSIVNVTERVQAEAELAASQTREQDALAETETKRQHLYNVLMQLPAQVAVYRGPDHRYQLVNSNYQRKFPHRSFIGRPFREGMPEAEGLGVVALFDQVYHTGEPYYAHELEGWFDFSGNGQREQFFFELSLHPLRNSRGEVEGVLDFSYEVTEQVLARRQLQQLNQELEARVQQRTQELAASHQAAEVLQANLLTAAQRQVQEREDLYQVFARNVRRAVPASCA
ncbi:PAS domain-containing protein, partial [Hymenobacter sp. AT01-02]|uniref:PAS domain-containing protein n=1 Tax=Hymenobacter sp. AT01-02 TaxID=1571877 RepID=UPI00128FB465